VFGVAGRMDVGEIPPPHRPGGRHERLDQLTIGPRQSIRTLHDLSA
jgi:hypothetical protein